MKYIVVLSFLSISSFYIFTNFFNDSSDKIKEEDILHEADVNNERVERKKNINIPIKKDKDLKKVVLSKKVAKKKVDTDRVKGLNLEANDLIKNHEGTDISNLVEIYDDILKEDPQNKKAIAMLSGLYFMRGDIENVVKYSEKCIEGSPKKSSCFSNLAYAYEKLGNTEKSENVLDKCIDSNPHQTTCYVSKGLSEFKKGNKERSLEFLNQALRNSKNDLDRDSISMHIKKISKSSKE